MRCTTLSSGRTRRAGRRGEAGAKTAAERVAGFRSASTSGVAAGAIPICDLRPRQRARVAGRIRTVRVQPRAGVSSLECTISDGTGQVMAVFQGRRRVAGIEPGARVVVEGMVASRGRNVGMVNPLYWVISTPDHAEPSSTRDSRGNGSRAQLTVCLQRAAAQDLRPIVAN